MTAVWRRTFVAVATILAGCDHYGIVAPDGATFLINKSRDSVAVGGDSMTIAAAVFFETGDLVRSKTDVTFLTTLGGVCLPRGSGEASCEQTPGGIPAVKAHTGSGVAAVSFRSGGDTGSAKITVRSGAQVDSVFIHIFQPTAAP
jgi:hypothetical protein